jgi:hypothetical protein
MLFVSKLKPLAIITESLVRVMFLPEKFVTAPHTRVSKIMGVAEPANVAREVERADEVQEDIVSTVNGVPLAATQSLGL